MKKVFALSFSVIFIFALVVICFAHPGGTDSNGGHYDRDAGEYHYHHGYPAHQHEDGICPYEYEDYEDNYEEKKEKSTLSQVLEGAIDFLKELGIYFLIIYLFVGLVCIVDYFKKKRK